MLVLFIAASILLGIMLALFRSLFLPAAARPGFDRGMDAIGRFLGRVFFIGVLVIVGAVVYFGFIAPSKH